MNATETSERLQEKVSQLQDLIAGLRQELLHKNKVIDALKNPRFDSASWSPAPAGDADSLQSRKIESIGRMAVGMAHDFNNLLVAVNGYSAFLLEGNGLSEDARSGVEEISKAGIKAAELTRQLLAFSSNRELPPGPINLNSVIGELRGMLNRLLGKRIEVQVLLDANLDTVQGRAGEMNQIILNLMLNARDAMPGGGRITLATANAQFPLHSRYFGKGGNKGPCIKVTVSDSGSGMDSSTVDRIFEPFFTTKTGDKGTGMGLYTVFEIVRNMGGDIEVASHPGRGTVFNLYFPSHTVAEESSPAITNPKACDASPISPTTLLIVEDDASVRRLVGDVLRLAGHQVMEAANGEEALEICSSHAGIIEGMITDKMLPRHFGAELALQVREMRPEMRVLFMSGIPPENDGENPFPLHSLPGCLFLEKPFTPKTLMGKVRELLSPSGANNASIAR